MVTGMYYDNACTTVIIVVMVVTPAADLSSIQWRIPILHSVMYIKLSPRIHNHTKSETDTILSSSFEIWSKELKSVSRDGALSSHNITTCVLVGHRSS